MSEIELAARRGFGWGACATASGRRASSQGGALTATRAKLYGLPFLFPLWYRRRSPFCSSRMLPFRGLSGVSMKIFNYEDFDREPLPLVLFSGGRGER